MLIHPTGKFDNAARTYKTITAHPLAAAMGAEIRGADFTNMSDAQFAEIEDALFHHKMIYFRDVEWTHDEHEAFSLRFGDWAEDGFDWLQRNFSVVFDGLSDALEALIDAILWVLQTPHPLIVIGAFAALAFALPRRRQHKAQRELSRRQAHAAA